MNGLLPSGLALVQEVETRFGTTHEHVARFLKSVKNVTQLINSTHTDSAATFRSVLHGLHLDRNYIEENIYPSLESIVNVLKYVRRIQTAFGNSKAHPSQMYFEC